MVSTESCSLILSSSASFFSCSQETRSLNNVRLTKRKGNTLKEAHTFFCCRYICLLSQSEERLRVTKGRCYGCLGGGGGYYSQKIRCQNKPIRYVPFREKGFRLPFLKADIEYREAEILNSE